MNICAYMRVVFPLTTDSRYYALSAASALFKNAEAKIKISFADEYLRIRYVQVEGNMMID